MNETPLHINAAPGNPNTFWQGASGRYYRTKKAAQQDNAEEAVNLFRQTQKENHHGSRGRGRRCRARRALQKAHHTHKLEITLNKNLAL